MDGTAERGVESATARLPERQREALESRELQGLSYEEIAASMETTWECVAQLVAHGWINLYDELEGTILASVAPSPECERALGLIAARDDGEVDADSAEAHWLDAHLEGCGRCQRGVEEMGEARKRCAIGGTTPAARGLRHLPLVAGLLALLLLAGVATAFVRDESPPAAVDQAVGAAEPLGRGDGARNAGKAKQKEGGEGQARTTKPSGPDAPPTPTTASAPVTAPSGSHAPDPASRPTAPQDRDSAGIEPTQRTSSPSPSPKPPATTTSAPAPAPPPDAEPPPVEEADDGPPYGREPPGRAVGHGPR